MSDLKITDLDHDSLSEVISKFEYKIDIENFARSINDKETLSKLFTEHKVKENIIKKRDKRHTKFISVNDGQLEDYYRICNLEYEFDFSDNCIKFRNEIISRELFNKDINYKYYFYVFDIPQSTDEIMFFIIYNNRIDLAFFNMRLGFNNIGKYDNFVFNHYIKIFDMNHGIVELENGQRYLININNLSNPIIEKCVEIHSNRKYKLKLFLTENSDIIVKYNNTIFNCEKDIGSCYFKLFRQLYDKNKSIGKFSKIVMLILQSFGQNKDGATTICMDSDSLLKYNQLLLDYYDKG